MSISERLLHSVPGASLFITADHPDHSTKKVDDPAPQPTQQVQAATVWQTNVSTVSHPASVVAIPVSQDVSNHQAEVYQHLLSITDFSTAPVLQTVNKYLSTLAGVALDDRSKFKIALNQATTIEQVQPQQILNVFDACKKALEAEVDKFTQAMSDRTAVEVTGRDNKIADLNTQVAAMQAQIGILTNEKFAEQQKIQSGIYTFGLVAKQREAEIDQELTKFQSLLS